MTQWQTAGTYGSFELAGLFASSLQKKSINASTIDSRGTACYTSAISQKSPRSMGMPRKWWLTMNQPRLKTAMVL